MFVCICKAISESELLDTIRQGNNSLKDIQRACGAGTDCGSCCSKVNEFLNKVTPLGYEQNLPKASSDE